MAHGIPEGMALGAAGYGIGKARQFIGRDVPTELGNIYTNPPKRIADAQLEKG